MTAGYERESEERLVEGVAAWLVAAGEIGRGGENVCALRRSECLEVARAGLMTALADPATNDPAGVPGLAVWVDRLPSLVKSRRSRGFLEWLADAVVLPGETRAAALSGGGTAAAEGALLRDSLRFAIADAALRESFDRAVEEARIEAMRELAYGAGHEINNPLANIATRAQSLLLEESDPERRRRLSTIVDQSFRARDMIGGLMVFARPPKARSEPSDVGSIAESAIEAVRSQCTTRGVRLEYSPLPVPLDVFVDRTQVEEALRTVLVNAVEAVGAGGRVVVRVAVSSPDTGRQHCELTVEDDGRGMTPEQKRRAFDPFYSGREAGRGAGIGLAKAWRLVASSGGETLVDSRIGGGTQVSIRLPLQDAG